jgi:hypothetical protein
MQIVLHNQDNREHDLLDSDDYYQFQGGLTAAVRALTGKILKLILVIIRFLKTQKFGSCEKKLHEFIVLALSIPSGSRELCATAIKVLLKWQQLWTIYSPTMQQLIV